jgi:hypothetical protein
VQTHHPQRAVNAERRAWPRLPSRDVAGRIVKLLDGQGRIFFVQGTSANESELWARRGIRT